MADQHELSQSSDGPSSQHEQGKGFPLKLILLGLVALYLLLFIILNADSVSVSFVFFSAEISLIVGFVLVAVLGFIAGYMTNELRARRKRTSKPKPQ